MLSDFVSLPQRIWYHCAHAASSLLSRYVGLQKYSCNNCPWNSGPYYERWDIIEIDVFDFPVRAASGIQ